MSTSQTSHHDRGGVAEMLAIALPMVISTACDGIMTFTDRMFLSRIGPDPMNAAMAGGVAMQAMMFFFIGLTGYSTALVAQYYGSGRKMMAPVAAFQAILISLAAYPVILLLRPLVSALFPLMNIPEGQIGYQVTYFNIVIYGVVISLLRNSLSCYFSGLGRTRVVMVASLIAMGVNVGLDYIMIFGKLGFPAMGIRGAAIATVSGSFTGLLILAIAYLSRMNRLSYNVLHSFRYDREAMRKLVHFGYPAGLELFLNFIAFSAMIMLFQSRGTAAATASTIMFSWDMISFIPLLGIEIAVTSLVGRYMGAGDPETAHKAAMSGIKTGIFYSMAILLLFVTIPGKLVLAFRPDVGSDAFNEAIPMAKTMIRLASLYVLAEAMTVALVGALRGAGDTRWTMMATVTLHWAFVPVLALMFYGFEMSAVSGWLALIIAFLIFCVFLYRRYHSGKWKSIRVLAPEIPVERFPS